jgi:transcription factor C subunit 7
MFPAYDNTYIPSRTPSKQGETLAQLYARVAATARAIIHRSDSEGHRAVVLCSHAAVVIALGRVLTGSVPDSPDTEDFQAFTCGLSMYRRQQGGGVISQDATDTRDSETSSEVALGGWMCELNSDCSFLSSGAERGW